MYNLLLYQRVTGSGAFLGNYTRVARRWRRSTRAIGGFWLGSFELSERDLSWTELVNFYNSNLGCRLLETTYGMTSWEGLVYELRLTKGGQEYRRTLKPEWWHNKVKTMYSFPAASDTEQGNLAYNPAANSFQDDGQDFSDWETLAGAAAYSIYVTNADGTKSWGFLGADFTTANANDSIYIYTDVELNTAGWNGEVSGKTPSTYTVRDVSLAGSRQDTGWSENTDSSDEYGEMQYVVSLGGATVDAAVAIRDVELTEFAWPRSRKMGGGSTVGDNTGAWVLEVSCAGFWATLNWLYRVTSRTAAASDMITTLVGTSEFVTVQRIESNSLAVKADCDPIPQRLGDLCEGVILQGDVDGGVWQGGVYANRKFVYEQAPTSVTYYVRGDGVLVDKAGMEVIPSSLKAGFLLRDERAPSSGQPVGTSSVWDDPKVAYVEEVEFLADKNELRYRLLGEEESAAVLMEQIRRGSVSVPEAGPTSRP